MNRHLHKTLFNSLQIILLAAAAVGASAQDGQLVDAATLKLSETDLKTLQARDADLTAALNRIEIKSITYLSDQLKVKGYLAIPKKTDKLPCVIWNRGGNREFGALKRFAGSCPSRPAGLLGLRRRRQPIPWQCGGRGQGGIWRPGCPRRAQPAAAFKVLTRGDATRVGMCGYSRGGMMTYLALKQSDQIAAAVVGYGLADAFNNIASRPDMETNVLAELVPNYRQNKIAALEARSAVRWPEKLNKNTPILLLHGTADWRVGPMEAIHMATALYEAKHPFRLVLFEGGAHGLPEHRDEVNRLTRDWLDHYVRDRQPWPSLEPHGQ